MKNLPGPQGRFLVGNMPEMQKDVLGFYEGLHRDHGDLVKSKILSFDMVAVFAPHLIEQVLVTQHDKLQKGWDYGELRRVLGHGLVTSEGELWKRQRRLIQPSFSRPKVAVYADIMSRRATDRLATWEDGANIDMLHEMNRITLEIICESMLGVDVGEHADVIGDAVSKVMRQFEAMFSSKIPLPLWVPTKGNREAFAALKKMDAVLNNVIVERRASGEGGEDLLGKLIAATDEDGGKMDDAQLRDEIVTMVTAGHETTALALTWTHKLLAEHPEVRDRLEAELDAVIGDRAVTIEDVGRLTYTRQVIDEAMRLYPPVWGVGRQVKKGATLDLDGHQIPAGTQVFVVQYVTHRDPRFFPDPQAFDPDRWAEGRPKPPKYAYFPFIGGPRSCIGMHFALMEACIVLAETARRYRFELSPYQDIDLQPAITLRPRHGLKGKVARRRPQPAVKAA